MTRVHDDHRVLTHRRLRGPRPIVAAAAVLVLFCTVVGLHLNRDRPVTAGVSVPAAAAAFSRPTWGVLGGSCAADRVTALHDAGIRLVELGVSWDDFEPEPGRFDQSYIDAFRSLSPGAAAPGSEWC